MNIFTIATPIPSTSIYKVVSIGGHLSCRFNLDLFLHPMRQDCGTDWIIALLQLGILALTGIGLVSIVVVSIAYARRKRRPKAT